MEIRSENWNGHEIRFVETEPGEWWAVLADVTKVLDLKTKYVRERLDDEVVSTDHIPDKLDRLQEMLIVNEFGIYDVIFSSRKKEAKAFKKWVYSVIKTLRQQSGLEGFQIFRMLDKEHQKEAMKKLNQSLQKPKQVNFIKANTIANKAVSTKYGYKKMLKKNEMSPDMLIERQPILEDTVNLMCIVDKFGINISVSDEVYKKYAN